jgi:hypothetical protein
LWNTSQQTLEIPENRITSDNGNIRFEDGQTSCEQDADRTQLIIPSNRPCDITFSLTAPAGITAEIKITDTSISIPNADTSTSQTFPVTGSMKPNPPQARPQPGEPTFFDDTFINNLTEAQHAFNQALAINPTAGVGASSSGASGTTGSGGSSAAPLGWTYLGDVFSALNTAKTSMAYSSAGHSTFTCIFRDPR